MDDRSSFFIIMLTANNINLGNVNGIFFFFFFFFFVNVNGIFDNRCSSSLQNVNISIKMKERVSRQIFLYSDFSFSLAS